MRAPLMAATLLAACQTTPAELPASELPTAGQLALNAPQVFEGESAQFRASNIDPGERVYFLASTGNGAPLCPPQTAPVCLGISGPLTVLGSRIANSSGVAQLNVRPPAGTAGLDVSFQAVQPSGNHTSNVSQQTVEAFMDTGAASTCPNPSGVATGTNVISGQAQEVIIALVDWEEDIIVLSNTTGTDVDLSSGDLCTAGFKYNAFSGVGSPVVPANGLVTIHLTATGTNTATEWFLNDNDFDLGPADVIMLYRNRSGHQPSGIEAYVRYGDSSPTFRQNEAVSANLWDANSTIPACPGSATALFATGDVTETTGFTCIDHIGVCIP